MHCQGGELAQELTHNTGDVVETLSLTHDVVPVNQPVNREPVNRVAEEIMTDFSRARLIG